MYQVNHFHLLNACWLHTWCKSNIFMIIQVILLGLISVFRQNLKKKYFAHFYKKNVIHRSAFMLFHTVSILSHAEFGPNDLWENASHLNFPGAFFDILVKNVQNICFLTFWISWELILGPTIVYD